MLQIGIQLKNIQIQFENINFQILNYGINNIGAQIENMGIQMINIGIQMIDLGIQVPNIDNIETNIKQQMQDVMMKIQNISIKIDNKNQMEMMNKMMMNQMMMNQMNQIPMFNMGINNDINEKFVKKNEEKPYEIEKYNIEFRRLSKSSIKLLVLDKDTKIKDMLEIYQEKFSNPKEKLFFIFNASKIKIDDDRKIKDLFNWGINPVITITN